MSGGLALAPEALESIRAAQEELDRQAVTMAAVGDPTAPTAAAMAATAKAMHRLMVDVFLKVHARLEATDKLLEQGRKPWTREEMRMLIDQLDETLLHRWSQFNRAAIAVGVVVTLAFGVVCVAGGWWWRGDPPELQCGDQPDGSRVCWMYERLPSKPVAKR